MILTTSAINIHHASGTEEATHYLGPDIRSWPFSTTLKLLVTPAGSRRDFPLSHHLASMSLSSRAREVAKPDPKYFFWEILQNAWDPETNPDGYLCLGLAENVLMHDILSKHVHASIQLPNEGFTYGDGKKTLRLTLAKFINKYFQPLSPVAPNHITVSNGCSSAIEHLAWAFGEPGDLFLLGKPYYGTFVPDVTLRMGTQLSLVNFPDIDPIGPDCVQQYEKAIKDAHSIGKRVAGLILANPHNPLGRCYSKDTIIRLMKLCEEYKVNFISDEIYALSTFTNTVDSDVEICPFTSALSIDTTGVIDPALVHAVWGISKDFGANGLRLGAIISQNNPELHASLVPGSLYSSTSALTDHVAENFLSDEPWVEEYLKQNRQALRDSYGHIVRWARRHEIEYAPGVNAAFFLWVNLGAIYQRRHGIEDGKLDEVIMNSLLQNKVFLASGAQFGSEKPGWFRIVFTQKREYLDEGLNRVVTAIENFQ